jgi:hypothetical protein
MLALELILLEIGSDDLLPVIPLGDLSFILPEGGGKHLPFVGALV